MDLKERLLEAFLGAFCGAIAGPLWGGLLLSLWNRIQEWLSRPPWEPDTITSVFWCCAGVGVMVRLSTIREARNGKFD